MRTARRLHVTAEAAFSFEAYEPLDRLLRSRRYEWHRDRDARARIRDDALLGNTFARAAGSVDRQELPRSGSKPLQQEWLRDVDDDRMVLAWRWVRDRGDVERRLFALRRAFARKSEIERRVGR